MAPITPSAAMKGRKMKGGWNRTSRLLVSAAAGRTTGVGVGLSVGLAEASGEGDSEGEGGGDGVGVGEPCSSNWAHGTGGTLAQILCSPGGSPANGLTLTPEKLPCPSAVAEPITLLGASQNSDIGSPGRKLLPLTLTAVLAPPALTSSVR